MAQLYRNTRSLRVRFLQILFWAATLGFAAIGFLGGPDPDSWLVGAILAPIFALFALGMEWYLRCYVSALEATETGLVIETLSTVGRTRKEVPWSDVDLAGDIGHRSEDDEGPAIDNSAALLRVRGRAMLIVDTTSDRFEVTLLQRRLRASRAA